MKLINLLEKIIGSNNLIIFDRLLGFRAWGLILYGVLSPSLILLGVSNLKMPSFDNLSSEFLILIGICSLILLTESIICQTSKYYLTKDHFYFRSLAIAFVVIFSSTFVIWVSGIADHNYQVIIIKDHNSLNVAIKCLLLSSLSLLIPSAIFISSVTNKINFPGLPSNLLVDALADLGSKMRELVKIRNWTSYTDCNLNFIKLINEIETVLDRLDNSEGNDLTKKSLCKFKYDLVNLKKGIKLITLDCENCELKNEFHWQCLFDNSDDLNEGQRDFRSQNKSIFESIQRIKFLKIGE